MKTQVRRGIFETNSSSVHCFTMCSKSDYDLWKSGKLLYDEYSQEFVERIPRDRDVDDFLTYDEFWDKAMEYTDYFEKTFKDVVGFGYYGYNC